MTRKSLSDRLEDAILLAVRYGRWLAEDWSQFGPDPAAQDRATIRELLASLNAGEVLDMSDDPALDRMGDALRIALNELKPGYGDLAIRADTSEHFVCDQRRERLRQLIEQWKSLKGARQDVRDLTAALRAFEDRTTR